MKNKLFKYLKLFLKLGITFTTLWIVFSKIEIRDVGTIISSSNLWYSIIAIVFFILSKVTASFRLNRFFKCTDLNLSEKLNLKLYILGMYYNLFLPGGIGGDGYKIYFLNKIYKIPAKKLFWAVLLDRITGVLSLLCLAILFMYFIPMDSMYYWFLWLGIPFGLFAFHWVVKVFFKEFLLVYTKTNLQSLFVQLFQLISAWFILLSIGINDQAGQYLFVFLISSLVAVIPFTIGGAGAREITFLFGAQILNLNSEYSIALSLIFYLITAAVSFTGIYFSFRAKTIL